MDKCPSCDKSAFGYDLWVCCPCCGHTFCRHCGISEDEAQAIQDSMDEGEAMADADAEAVMNRDL